MRRPRKPFPEYKWRWATLTCTESLNYPPVFLGVLRAMREHEGKSPSDPDFNRALTRVQEETGTTVRLSRSPERNLIRNSGQYWKALGLLVESHGEMRLTQFGRKVADGDYSPSEFAAAVIKDLELPNTRIDPEAAKWRKVGLRIKPLELILRILDRLGRNGGGAQAYITPEELVKITIPLAGQSARVFDHVQALLLYRTERLNVSTWPNCTPQNNDRRMAREFLYFLAHYGFCKIERGENRDEDKFSLGSLDSSNVRELLRIKNPRGSLLRTARRVSHSGVVASAERRRVLMEVLARPEQTRFRRDVLNAFRCRCILTGSSLREVLQAAHIVPVNRRGPDTVDNGLCLRSDIHLLFDSGHIRISSTGDVTVSESARRACYGSLPQQIEVPDFVNRQRLEWRIRYC